MYSKCTNVFNILTYPANAASRHKIVTSTLQFLTDDWQPYKIRSCIIFEMVKDSTLTQEAHIKVVREQSDELDTNGDSINSSDSSEDELEES